MGTFIGLLVATGMVGGGLGVLGAVPPPGGFGFSMMASPSGDENAIGLGLGLWWIEDRTSWGMEIEFESVSLNFRSSSGRSYKPAAPQKGR